MIDMFFKFTGRLNRKPFIWRYLLLIFIAGLMLTVLKNEQSDFLWVLIAIVTVAQISLIIRRANDLNFSLPATIFTIVISLIPLVSLIPFILLACKKGTDGINIYGIDPLEHKNG